MTNLDFLSSSVNVYYAGLDYRGFPFGETVRRIGTDQKIHIRYLKVLALLADHIIIPPSFLVFAMKPSDKNETFTRSTVEFFQANKFLTSIYSTMNNPVDFFHHKTRTGDEEERDGFLLRKNEACTLFSHIPLFHRNVTSESNQFKNTLLGNIEAIPDNRLSQHIKEQIRKKIKEAEMSEGVALSRKTFIAILNTIGLRANRRAYRLCFYAMNAAYYNTGAQLYKSDIACLSVEEYSILQSASFEIENSRILVGYDPSIFYNMLIQHGVTPEEIDAISIDEINRLKAETCFVEFSRLYKEFIELSQQMSVKTRGWSKSRICKLKAEILNGIETRFHAERKQLDRWRLTEDIGTGFLLAALGGVLGCIIVGPAGILFGTGLGLVSPVIKLGRLSISEIIATKLSKQNYKFYLFIEHLTERLGKLESHV